MTNGEYRDCEHCAKTYGTLGCCDTVSNEWVYSCKEGHEEYARGMRKFGSTTKNNLGVDCISRKSIKQKLQEHYDFFVDAYGGFINLPQNDKSRVDEITNCIAMVVNEPPVTPQEPFKPMVEIDLYSVIKQKYIEREVLDKIRAEIETKYGQCDICEYFEDYDYEENDISEYRPIGDIADILQIIDKYRTESEPQESEDT